ncbi:N-acetyltransferase [Salidesulfovibrio onnuriiensis]|uniref:N-acetyltransferase n=1 Tax=Salidesulfovibrio onnuriiensis TaxID=2583823 RepID=UPI0011CA7855|nr:N-acetyltransferase [Salidesulfovibrio onnuriiensis]
MIRKMKKADVDGIVDVWLQASVRAHDFVDRAYWEGCQETMREIYIPNSETWVYEDAGRVVGFYSLVDDMLAAIFVQPERQGEGIGAKLLEHAKKQRERLELCVYVENVASCAFYQRRGFVVKREQLDENTGHREYLMEYVPLSGGNEKK